MFSITTPGRLGTHDLPWLRLIHAANDVQPRMFGEPLKNSGGVEIYLHATVTHNDDGTVTVAARDDHGHSILLAAAKTVGLIKVEMTDKDALRLAELLAKYAAAYGKDCDGDITVKVLADDLASANTDPALTTRIEEARDAIYDGLNQ